MKFCLKLSIVCFFSFWSGLAAGQTLSITLGLSGSVEAAQAVTLYKNDIVIGGTKNDSAFVMRLQPDGTPLWIRTFKKSFFAGAMFVNSLDVTGDGFIVGTAFGLGGGVCNGSYFKIDGSGNMVFLKAATGSFYFQRIIEKNATEYFILSDRYSTSGTGSDLKIFTADKLTGNIIWQTDKINITSGSMFTSTDDLEGSTFVDGTWLYTTGRSWVTGSSTSFMRPHLLKYNLSGSVVWSKYLHKSFSGISRTYSQDILYKAPDNLFIPYFSDETCVSSCSNYIPGLMKLDTSGHVLFDKTYDILSSNGELVRGFVTDGLYYYIIGYTNFNGGQRDIFVLKIDKDGNLIRSKKFGSPSYNELFNTSIIRPAYCDSSYIYIAGAVDDDIVLMKLDTALNLACNESLITCDVQSVVPFAGYLSYAKVFEDLTVSNEITQSSYIPQPPLCDSLNIVDSIYSTTPITLDATYPGADGYFWNVASTGSSITVGNSGVYVCIVNDGCCSFNHIFVVCIPSIAAFAIDSTVFCNANQYSFYPLASSSNTGFNWYVDGVYISSSNSLTTSLNSGQHTISLVVSNPICLDSLWSSITTLNVSSVGTQIPVFLIPNIFTPNNDGMNDVFEVKISSAKNYRIRIFNRWGNEIFTSDKIDQPWLGKIGTNNAAEGVYGYIISYYDACINSNEKVLSGWISLLR